MSAALQHRRVNRTTTRTQRRHSRPSQSRQSVPVARTRARKKSLTLGSAMAIFSVTLLVSFFLSSIAGNAMLEKTRRERIRSQERAIQARSDAAQIRRSLDFLTSMKSVDRYATANQMVLSGVEMTPAPDFGTSTSPTLVASNHRAEPVLASEPKVEAIAPETIVSVESNHGEDLR